jgi:hypothetical protein
MKVRSLYSKGGKKMKPLAIFHASGVPKDIRMEEGKICDP